MAKYVVGKKDNPLQLAKKFETSPQRLLEDNRILSLTAGQTINVPSKRDLDLEKSRQTIGKSDTRNVVPTGSFISGSGTVNTGSTGVGSLPYQGGTPLPNGAANVHTQVPVFGGNTQTGGMLSGDKVPVITQPNLVGGSFVSGSGQVNTGGQGNVSAVLGASTPANSAPVRPTGVYTGGNSANDIAWRNYWNYQAKNPTNTPVAPTVMTREQVWEMKAAQRRREGNGDGGEQAASYEDFPTQFQPSFSSGNAVNQNISWRL